MSTTLDSSFLRSVILVSSFRGDDINRAQAALLLIGLHLQDFTAGHLPKEICGRASPWLVVPPEPSSHRACWRWSGG